MFPAENRKENGPSTDRPLTGRELRGFRKPKAEQALGDDRDSDRARFVSVNPIEIGR